MSRLVQAALWSQSLQRLDLSRKRLHELHSTGNMFLLIGLQGVVTLLMFEGWIDSLRYVYIYVCMLLSA